MIILAATPIGNLGDASPRLREALETASVIAAEDTRMATHLMQALRIGNRPRLISMFEHNELSRVDEVLDLAGEQDVLVISDAGMPTVSDPGYALVAAARERGVEVTALPGPSAPITALALSGLPTDRFSFEGFVPRKAGERARLWRELATDRHTLIFFESARRLAVTLAEMASAFGPDRRASVARELTKKFEQVRTSTLGNLAEWAAQGVRGEIVIVVAGAARQESIPDPAELVGEVRELTSQGMRLTDACAQVSARTGASRKQLYALAVGRAGTE
ncbi:MAG TPA: 16S rRNA (cytidine(1402)-2'-O)-methyltransferase [Pseudoclavibacter sp.]|nr:16S rRNA (cytidine(1402)-2'-O)-methyltransferase [Pseudoclavibacter sp.]